MSRYTYTHQVTLRPLDKFFFGGQNYYAKEDGVFYYQTSRDFPQQTTLLGMLRYQILCQNDGIMLDKGQGLQIDDKIKAAQYIGEKSFDGEHTDFGKIKSLSPVFIVNASGEKLTSLWRAKEKLVCKEGNMTYQEVDLQIDFMEGQVSFGHDVATEKVPVATNFDHKAGFEYGFYNKERGTFYKYEAVFDVSEEAQVGIYKPYREVENEEEEGFFKLKYCRLKAGFAFSFYTQLDNLTFGDTKVTMGKERTVFDMKVTSLAKAITLQKIAAGDKVVLLSDSQVPLAVYKHCKAVVSETISFQNLSYVVKDDNNYDAKPTKEQRQNLLQRGTLLLVKDDISSAAEVEKLLNKATAFQQIGYNHYQISKNPST